MAEYDHPVRPGIPGQTPKVHPEPPYRPYWARSPVQYAQDLLGYSEDPIEYDYNDRDYWDNCFFFPEDCSWSPPKGWIIENKTVEQDIALGDCYEQHTGGNMIPGLPDIKMLDAEALSDLLEDNLSPPEITSMMYGHSYSLGNGDPNEPCFTGYSLPMALFSHTHPPSLPGSCAT